LSLPRFSDKRQTRSPGIPVDDLSSSIKPNQDKESERNTDANQSSTASLRGYAFRRACPDTPRFFHIDVSDWDGKVTSWMIEGCSPNPLVRRGLTRTSIPEGTKIVVDGYVARDGSNRANGRDIPLAGRRKLFVGSSGSEEQSGNELPDGK
jgi:hypothetical protein